MDSMSMYGAPSPMGDLPTMVSSQTAAGKSHLSLLDLMFETNPLDGSCDQKVVLNSRPLEIIYDAVSIYIGLFFQRKIFT